MIYLQVPKRTFKETTTNSTELNRFSISLINKHIPTKNISHSMRPIFTTKNKFSEYGYTAEHINIWTTAGGDEKITDYQQIVINKLRVLDGVHEVYLNENTIEDIFMVVSKENQSIKAIDLANKYWEIYDLINKDEHTYDFHFEHFEYHEVPPHVRKAKLIYRG